ncbi:MAG TPA: GTPase domain-containing protein [Anaerolineae bacterium]|nr:GTPase domain-containing protein [Anaerolineae bacterium]HQK13920.1 GTPase domain-containing protein [Anaerolineae bacterium]
MFINWKTREVNLNIVYYGPALSGKTTNLEQIHARMKAAARSELFTLNTHEDRTIFFDFMQVEIGQVAGLRPKFGLYTVPGQVYYEATREAVLRRADALVFVADSQAARLDENIASWRDMARQLARMNRPLGSMPLVVQFNKRDLPDALPVADLQATLDTGKLPYFEAVAVKGIGVPETLQAAMRYLLLYVQHALKTQSQGVSG